MKVRIASLIILISALALPTLAYAQAWLVEDELSTPFQLARQRQIGVATLSFDSQEGFALASALPPTTSGLDVVEFKWPKRQLTCQLGIGQTAQEYGQQFAMPKTYLAIKVADGEPRIVPGIEQGLDGVVARVCVWATELSGEAELVLLFTCSEGPDDSIVRGFSVNPDGAVTEVNTQQAATLYGWFECADLDGDGNFELITSRSLDASPGGFFYHAVRAYDAAQSAYVAAPDAYREYFAEELAWLDWVLSTRDLIQANPQQYMNQQQYGHIYTADYDGVTYGFDSIIELPETFTQLPDIDEYNDQRRESLRLIQVYRDELRAWLEGSSGYPSAWKLSHE